MSTQFMPETPAQYIERMLGLAGNRDPWIVLANTPNRLQALVAEATPRELGWTTSPARWSITQIVAHLADAELVGAWRIRLVLAADGTALQPFDQNEWASAFKYEKADPVASATLFGILRASTLALLRTVDPERLEHAGIHAERGRESIGHIMRMYSGHDLNHLGQIERLLDEARRSR
jgi:uncharacterized damage-inducible protein DinB